MMRRRHAFALVSALLCGGLSRSFAAPAGPRVRVSIGQLEDALGQRFPRRFPVAGLFDLDVDTPQLDLLPDLNRIASRMLVRAAGPALRRSYSGEFDLDFALRYEPADRSIRAHHLRVQSLRLDGWPAQSADLLEAYAKALADQAMLEVVVHRLSQQDLALTDAMGLQPGAITVTPDGLEIGFVNKPVS